MFFQMNIFGETFSDAKISSNRIQCDKHDTVMNASEVTTFDDTPGDPPRVSDNGYIARNS
jgi:hypothetical protein